MSRVLLLSGGLDSACVAAWLRPDHCLGINYGQKAAAAEQRSAAAISAALDIPFSHITVDASAVGIGLMSDVPQVRGVSAEWWPYRNQLLITLAAAWAVGQQCDEVLLGTVAGDGDRHADGRPEFFAAMRSVLGLQEGGLTVTAPAIAMTTLTLIERSGASDALLGWTHSCHVSDVPCGQCPGCSKRRDVLQAAGRLP